MSETQKAYFEPIAALASFFASSASDVNLTFEGCEAGLLRKKGARGLNVTYVTFHVKEDFRHTGTTTSFFDALEDVCPDTFIFVYARDAFFQLWLLGRGYTFSSAREKSKRDFMWKALKAKES